MLLKLVKTFSQDADLAKKCVNRSFASQAFAIELFQRRLVIKGVNLANTAGGKDMNHSLSAGRVMWPM